jgi:type III pantothenate kinase
MLLAIDIGNTQVKLGLFEGQDLVECFRLASLRNRTGDEYSVLMQGLFDPKAVDAIIIGSVVPTVGTRIDQAVRRLTNIEPAFVQPVEMNILPLRVDYPAEVGVDRVVNAYAAKKLYGSPLIVIDFGTATTFDAVSEDGAYEGGAIAAGVEIAAEALFEKTALLPRVRLKKPEKNIGRSTRTAVQIGLWDGLLGQVEFIVSRFKAEIGDQPRVVATGGLADVISQESSCIDLVDPDLCMKGLAMIHRDFLTA